MSRCFSFPPPEYTLSRSSMEYLFETIKLLTESEKAREQKKKKQKRRYQKKSDHIELKEKEVEIIEELEGSSSLTEENNGQLVVGLDDVVVPTSSSDSTNTTIFNKKWQFSNLPSNKDYSNDLRYGSEIVSYNELVGNCRSTPQLMMQDYPCLDVDLGWPFVQFKKPADDDLDWLLEKPDVSAEKRRKIQNGGVSCSSSLAFKQPFALPFTHLF